MEIEICLARDNDMLEIWFAGSLFALSHHDILWGQGKEGRHYFDRVMAGEKIKFELKEVKNG